MALQAGDIRFTLTSLYGSDFEGGHFARSGFDASGNLVAVPLHRHEVSLDYTRVELELQYAMSGAWSVALRAPWEQKEQHASIAFIDAATSDERAAILRGQNVHHRNETYRGLGDSMLVAQRRVERWSLGAGLTLPTGRTVENPYLLGDRGIEHLHIQFGSGTVDPLLEASYLAPFAILYANARLPLYENSRTFRAPPEISAGVSRTWRWFRAGAGVYYQGYGEWDGVRDENTGIVSTHAMAGVSWRRVRVDVRVPLSQRTLSEGDAFTQGPTVLLSVDAVLRR